MAMSKKDYEKLAWALRYAAEDVTYGLPVSKDEENGYAVMFSAVVSRVTQALRDTNPQFDADRFRRYVTSHCVNCGGPVEKEDNQLCNACAKLPKKDLTE